MKYLPNSNVRRSALFVLAFLVLCCDGQIKNLSPGIDLPTIDGGTGGSSTGGASTGGAPGDLGEGGLSNGGHGGEAGSTGSPEESP